MRPTDEGDGMPEDNETAIIPNPSFQKIGYRSGSRAVVIGAPEARENPLAPLPEGVSSLQRSDELKEVEGELDYIHLFTNSRAELAHVMGGLRDKLAPGGMLWISWIKQTSSKRHGGMPGDVNENVVRKLALSSGLVDVKVAALDTDWSALKLVRRKH
jgi:hypothetical protein